MAFLARRRTPLHLAALVAALFTARAAAAAEPLDVRLGSDVVPRFELVRLKLDPDKRSYTGSVHVELQVSRPADTVRFHAEGQRLTRISLLQGGDTVAVERTSGDHGLQLLATARPLKPGPATLDLEFTHLYGTRAVGLYRALREEKGYLFTQFESDDAREAFPCWDEPGFKQPWQLILEVPSAQQAFTNTPVEKTEEKDGWKTITFARTPPLPSYLLAIAVGSLETVDVPGTKVPTRIITCQGQKHLAGYTAGITAPLLGGLERWFGTSYPFAKLDLVAVPEFAYGAMENPGLITFRDDALLLDEASATSSQRRTVAGTLTHELAHMWFGDLVTMAWWDDLWLNESFADWMAEKIVDEVYPAMKTGIHELQSVQNVKNGDTQPSTQAIRDKTSSSAAGLQNVGLVYNKGNAVLAMFEHYLGAQTFQKGVRAYLKEHEWGNATASDLWRALDKASNSNVSASMSTFLDQPGVPLVRVVPAEGGVRLTQSRANPYGLNQPALRWQIPITLKWSDGKTIRTQKVLLREESAVVKLAAKPAWVMPNAGGHGYYAWSVPEEWMGALAEHADTDMDPYERMAFLGNLALLMTAGEVHGDTYLGSLAHFGRDSEPEVVSSTMEALAGVKNAFVPDSLSDLFAVYVRRTLAPALERIGYEKRPGEDEMISATRGDLLRWLAGRGRDEKVLAFAQDAAKRYLADSSAVDPGIVDASLSLAARTGDAALFDTYKARFEASDVPAIRRRYLAALGAFEDTALTRRALEYMFTDKVRPTEMFLLIRGMGGRDEASAQRLFDTMLANYPRIVERVPPPALRFMPMMGAGCSAERLARTQAFFTQPEHDAPGMSASLERVSDLVHTCISLRERDGDRVTRYMRGFATN